jgi:hypothetical protein
MNLILFLITLLLSTTAFEIPFNVFTVVDLLPNATVLAFDAAPGLYVTNAACTVALVLPANVTQICVKFNGSASMQGEEILFTSLFTLEQPIGSPATETPLDVLNYLQAIDTVLGPVFPGQAPRVSFEGDNVYQPDANLYTFVHSLPQYGVFFDDATQHTINQSDIQQPFLLSNNEAPFLFVPASIGETLNDSLMFQVTDGVNFSPNATLDIIVHSDNVPGVVTFPNNTCVNVSNTICINDGRSLELFIQVNYSDAAFWPPGRIIIVTIRVYNAQGITFTIPTDVAIAAALHQDLDGNFDSNIQLVGSSSFSTGAVLYAPLAMIQAAFNPLTIKGNNDGRAFNLGPPSQMPPFHSQLLVTTCHTVDENTGFCERNPSLLAQFYTNVFTYTRIPTSFSYLDFPWIFYLIFAIIFCCCLVPTVYCVRQSVRNIDEMQEDVEYSCVPFCKTYFLCCCCFSERAYREKKHSNSDRARHAQNFRRQVCVDSCGCCFCGFGRCGCCADKLAPEENSGCGENCGCCDAYAHKKSHPGIPPKYYMEPCEQCCRACSKSQRSGYSTVS